MLKADGFDEAIIGIAQRAGHGDLVAYDEAKCIEILARDMSYEEAREYFEFNVLGAWVGDGTPIFIDTECDLEELEGYDA